MIRSLQIIDTLHIGGAERMAVNVANSLSRENVESHICVTRAEGPLKIALNKDVQYFFLGRKSTLDIKALLNLRNYIKKHRINILHAHGTSFLLAVLVKVLRPKVKLIWHDHHGNRVNNTSTLKLMLLKLASFKFNLIYCVNNELKDWALKKLYCKKVEFIPNYPTLNLNKSTVLKGKDGKRILCLANLRNPKNHQMLFYVFKKLVEEYKDWSLHCVGNIYDDDYYKNLKTFITENNLEKHIFLYGSKNDVSHIIEQSNIGVLSSTSEGLPMALLEYGIGKLPVITTNVGYCGKLISDDSLGLLVESEDKTALYKGFKLYVSNFEYRKSCAENFHKKILSEFSEAIVSKTIVKDYNFLIA